MAITHNDVQGLWFGTEELMQWLPAPLSGAETSPTGWAAEGVLLNGGGFAANSFGSHKRYQYAWSDASARQTAQTMKSYADGTYGRGLIYFQDPLTFDTNVLPAMWADPSMGIGMEGASLVYGVQATSVATPNRALNNLPVNSAVYNLDSIATGFRGKTQAVFIPVPQGYDLYLGAFYSATGTGGVYYCTQSTAGVISAPTQLTALSGTFTPILNRLVSGSSTLAGVWLYVGKSSAVASTVTLSAMAGRLIKTSASAPDRTTLQTGPWIGGQGHSGTRFAGKPTYVEYNGVGGGQVGFAASFIEMGSWIYG